MTGKIQNRTESPMTKLGSPNMMKPNAVNENLLAIVLLANYNHFCRV